MWFKFAAIAALVFHRSDAIRSVDYWLRGSAYRPLHKPLQPINKEWKTDEGQQGSILLGNVVPAASEGGHDLKPKSKVPAGPPQDYTYLRHKAEGLKDDHPANRQYK